MAKQDPLEGLRDVARDLLRLEISLIVKPDLTARQCPSTPEALLDIAGEYYWYLQEAAEEILPDTGLPHLSSLESEVRTNGSRAFDDLRHGSRLLLDELGWSEGEASSRPDLRETAARRRVILQRIYRNSARLSVIADNEQSKAPEAERSLWNATRRDLIDAYETLRTVRIDLTVANEIRKVWEIGTEQVALQSIVQLDGDVVTRVSDQYVGPEHAQLHALHSEVCKLSIEAWETIASLVLSLIEGAVGSLKKWLFGR